MKQAADGQRSAVNGEQSEAGDLTRLPLPPGGRWLPFVGETVAWVRDPLRFAQERHARYGPVWRTHLLGRPCVVLLGPEANRFMLGTHGHLFSSRAGWGRSITTLIGNGLSLIDGPDHRRHRRLIRPALHGTALDRYFAAMEELTRRHTEDWPGRGAFPLFDGFKHLSCAIAAQLMLGLRAEEEQHAFHDTFAIFTRGLFALPAWKSPWLPYGHAWRAGQVVRRTLQACIERGRRQPGDDVLGLLLAARDEGGVGLTDAELVDELLVLLWAGHDTITSLLTWTVLELLRHPAVYAQALAEQAMVVGAGELTLPQLKSFPVLDGILREAERLHPPAPGGFRGVVEDFGYGGYRIPAGWTAMYSSVFTHHMPELWHAPQRFDPNRFAPGHGEGGKPFGLIGFGAGPRVCVGLAFAQMQMRLILSHLLRHYTFELQPGQDLRPVHVPTKMPTSGLLVRVTRRTVPPAVTGQPHDDVRFIDDP